MEVTPMMINTNEATCPTCGGTLYAHAHSNLEMLDNGDIVVTQVGTCDYCGNKYEWDEHYAYKGYSDVVGEKS